MDFEERTRSDKYLQAKKQVDELKGFYVHLAIYILVNLFISITKVISNISNGETFNEAFFDFGTFAVWIFWGIGIFFHAWGVFGRNVFFGKNWEEDRIKKYMEEDRDAYRNRYE